MNLKALRSLVAIHDAHSFVDAARRLGISQSTISMQIKSLEDELGVQLFDRSVRPPTMTLAAAALVKPLREILSKLDEITDYVRTHSSMAGTLRLGAIPTATLAILPGAMATLVHRYPRIRITIEGGLSTALVERVQEGLLDAVVVTEPPHIPPGLRCELILRERLALVAAKGLDAPIGLRTFHAHPFIRFNRRVGVGVIVNDFLATKGLAPEEFIELDSIEAILAMVERGLGIAIVPETTVGRSNRQRLRLSPIEDPIACRNVSLIFRSESSQRHLLDIALEALREAGRAL